MSAMTVIKGGKGDPSAEGKSSVNDLPDERVSVAKPSVAQMRYLKMGLDQPGGKLPLFDGTGQEIKQSTIRSCIDKGWAEPWFDNPIKPDWLICRLTEAGRDVVGGA